MKKLKKCIYHPIVLLLIIILVCYTGTGCGQPSGSWRIADSLVVEFVFFDDNVSHEDYIDGFPDIIEIMLPNQNYNDTLYYVLDATIYGIDNSAYTIDQNLTKWVTINDSFGDMNMKILKEGNSIICYPWAGGMGFIDTLKIVRVSDENGISASSGIDSAFSFKVAVYNIGAKQYEYYQKDFNMSFKKSMKIEVDYTIYADDFFEGDFNIDNIISSFENLISDNKLYIDNIISNSGISEHPPVVNEYQLDLMFDYSHPYHNSALDFELYEITDDERTIEIIFYAMGGIACYGVTTGTNGNLHYYSSTIGDTVFNNPVFLNVFALHNVIKYNDTYYWEGEIGNSTFKVDEFRKDLSKAEGMILAHEIGHNAGNLQHVTSKGNHGYGYNVMYVCDDLSINRTMACYLDRHFDLWQKGEILRISQFYFKGNNGRRKK